mmetsp:Transcript_21560/g.32950  ORF Transcript_21560/g.32950 Transcript_21560/m.32950 type:complete len:82 (-) Transcript_21560:3789-4034(-)
MNESSECNNNNYNSKKTLPNNIDGHDKTLCKGCKRWNCPCGDDCEEETSSLLLILQIQTMKTSKRKFFVYNFQIGYETMKP